MGERINSFELKPTAENTSEKLDQETFSFLCGTIDGLCKVEPEEILADFALDCGNLDDILYTYKFISNPELFEKIANSSFSVLDENDALEATKFARIFQKALSSPPIIQEISEIKLDSNGSFIAFMDIKQEEMHITWKDVEDKSHIFSKLLENAKKRIENKKISEQNFPDGLKSYGGVGMSLIDEKVIVSFFGDSVQKNSDLIHGYAPGFLRNFQKNIELVFQDQFPEKEVVVEF